MTNGEIKKELISAREKYINEIKAELAGPGSEFSVPDSEHELICLSDQQILCRNTVSSGG